MLKIIWFFQNFWQVSKSLKMFKFFDIFEKILNWRGNRLSKWKKTQRWGGSKRWGRLKKTQTSQEKTQTRPTGWPCRKRLVKIWNETSRSDDTLLPLWGYLFQFWMQFYCTTLYVILVIFCDFRENWWKEFGILEEEDLELVFWKNWCFWWKIR